MGGVQPVRDRHHRASSQQSGHRPLEMTRGARVDQRRGLVEHQRVRVGHHQPGQRHLLRLRRSELGAPMAEHGVEAVRQLLHPVDGVHRAQGGQHRGITLLGGQLLIARQHDVVAHGADEHVVLLRDQRHLGAQQLQRQGHQLHPADLDLTGARPVDAGQQPAQRRLARPGRPHHRQPFPGLQVEVDAVQHVVALAVGEAQVVAHQVLIRRTSLTRHPVLRHVGDAQQTRGRRQADLQPVGHLNQAVERIDQPKDPYEY